MDRYSLRISDTGEVHVFKCEELSEAVCKCEEVSLCGNQSYEGAREEKECLPIEEARLEIARLTNRGDKPCRDCLIKLFEV
ncbi:hypothetical protein [Aquifex aeolicus]|uniref:hypothetical protein n=1 Tax=Aquifex aeolicus TaxID=63363 RepID=UPI00031FE3FC|nr:hypothetical protein [Aquifex aeolicus]